ncbi:septum formation initiator family protein [Xanthobacter dioxanivorans]|uniref:Septum formation initiator family protein n=1 Tax=Xanthobacter dioxanivorans TaxID=2528964 RepID=A0A974PLE7_9HYPH|nr:septum formation initiator family protein [Xanthobacter dioxanivorans]QRG05699.1 septum formation initiator family protein [Xanthobacter dioxanivorans]
MQSRSRLQNVLATLALHLGAAAVIGYFAYHAYNGDHGLLARRNFDQEIKEAQEELDALKAQRRAFENKVSLLAPTQLDPDMLDEEGRRQLNFINAKDLVLLRSK